MKKILLSAGVLFLFTTIILIFTAMGDQEVSFPSPPAESMGVKGEAVLAGGCFWGLEEIFQQLEGVSAVTSGYAGGSRQTARYNLVSMGSTAHAESVRILFDPQQISFQTLLEVFFSVAHDPTQLNYQGPDIGTQYRSAVFYNGTEQKRITEEYIRSLEASGVFPREIVTQVLPLEEFYPAEEYHQNFMQLNPSHPYILYWDVPKVKQLLKDYPELVK